MFWRYIQADAPSLTLNVSASLRCRTNLVTPRPFEPGTLLPGASLNFHQCERHLATTPQLRVGPVPADPARNCSVYFRRGVARCPSRSGLCPQHPHRTSTPTPGRSRKSTLAIDRAVVPGLRPSKVLTASTSCIELDLADPGVLNGAFSRRFELQTSNGGRSLLFMSRNRRQPTLAARGSRGRCRYGLPWPDRSQPAFQVSG